MYNRDLSLDFLSRLRQIFRNGQCNQSNYVNKQQFDQSKQIQCTFFNSLLNQITPFLKAYKQCKFLETKLETIFHKQSGSAKEIYQQIKQFFKDSHFPSSFDNMQIKQHTGQMTLNMPLRQQQSLRKISQLLQNLKCQKIANKINIESQIEQLVLKVNTYEAFIYCLKIVPYQTYSLSNYQKQIFSVYQDSKYKMSRAVQDCMNFAEHMKKQYSDLTKLKLWGQKQNTQVPNQSLYSKFNKYLTDLYEKNNDLIITNTFFKDIRTYFDQNRIYSSLISLQFIKNEELAANIIFFKQIADQTVQNKLKNQSKDIISIQNTNIHKCEIPKQYQQYRNIFIETYTLVFSWDQSNNVYQQKNRFLNFIKQSMKSKNKIKDYQTNIQTFINQAYINMRKPEIIKRQIFQKLQQHFSDCLNIMSKITVNEQQVFNLKNELLKQNEYEKAVQNKLNDLCYFFRLTNQYGLRLTDDKTQKLIKIEQIVKAIKNQDHNKYNHILYCQNIINNQRGQINNLNAIIREKQNHNTMFFLFNEKKQINKINSQIYKYKIQGVNSQQQLKGIQNQSKINIQQFSSLKKKCQQLQKQIQSKAELNQQLKHKLQLKQNRQISKSFSKVNQFSMMLKVATIDVSKEQNFKNEQKKDQNRNQQLKIIKKLQNRIKQLEKQMQQQQIKRINTKNKFQEEKMQIQTKMLDLEQCKDKMQNELYETINQIKIKFKNSQFEFKQKIKQKQKLIIQKQKQIQTLSLKYMAEMNKIIPVFQHQLSLSVITPFKCQNQSQFIDNSLLLQIQETNQNQKNGLDALNNYKKQFEDSVIIKLKSAKDILCFENADLKEENTKLNKQIQSMNKQLLSAKDKILQLNQKIQEQQKYCTKIKNQNMNLKKINGDYQKNINQILGLQRMNNEEIVGNIPKFITYNKMLFSGQIFEQDQQGKQILIKHISACMKMKIKKTVLLYKFDEKNSTNVHQYIDNKRGLVCVVKTPFAIVAGFYSGTLNKDIMTEKGLLISVTNNQSYALNDKKRAMTYDDFFVIFGNAQIRLRNGQKVIFSNFGVAASSYNARGKKIGQFLNEGDKKEVAFDTFQYFQVLFDE